ncbi:hypothetical protein FD755_009079, partial [Muntiacus reevesi]
SPQPRGHEPRAVPPPCRGGDCGEPPAQRVDKGDEYDTAAELFRSALAGLAEPDRDLCLRLGGALAASPSAWGRCGRTSWGNRRPAWRAPWPARTAGKPGPRPRGGAPGPAGLPALPAAAAQASDAAVRPHPACWRSASRARRLAGQARNLQLQRQPEAALAGCHQALDLLCLSMKNCEQALQDAGEVCQNEPLLPKGHHVKAQALSGLGRSKEMLKEFLYCLALNPKCNSVKKEAQKVFFPASENVPQNLTSSTQNILLNMRLKAHCQSCVTSQGPVEDSGSAGRSKNPSEKPDVFRNSSSSVLHFILGLHCEEDQEVLDDLLPTEPSTGLKRVDSLPQRNVNSNTGASEELPIEVADFGCALCMRFCLKCQERCLDHALLCPVCKISGLLFNFVLLQLLASRNFNTTTLAEELIFRYFSDELLTRDVPIFACAMAFPTVPCPLHVFEPRYRLMMRRCMEMGTKWFGMCLSAEHAGISEYSCMLEVKDVRTFPGGRSVVNATGISRFRVLSHRHRDGYNTVDIEYLEDERVSSHLQGRGARHAARPSYQQPASRLASLQDPEKEQTLSHFGLMPDRGPEPQMLAVLPLEQKAQLAILGIISLKECLLAIRQILVIIMHEMNSWQELVNSRERNS